MQANGSFWDIRAQGKVADVDIFGLIGDYTMLGEESVIATEFIRELRGVGRVSQLNVNIHSEGGSVWDGMAIYRALRDFPAQKYVRVPAMAFSAASFIMLAGDTIEVGPETAVMIHNPMSVAMGDERQMQAASSLLAKSKSQILDIYTKRTGADRDHLSELMDAETWFIGDEIKAAGFADKLTEDVPKMRIAAGPLQLTNLWRRPPESVLKRKPALVSPEIAARLEKLRSFK